MFLVFNGVKLSFFPWCIKQKKQRIHFFPPHFLGSVLINRFYDKNCAHNLSDRDRNHTFFSPFFFPDKNPFNSGSESKDDAVKTVTGGLRVCSAMRSDNNKAPNSTSLLLSQPSLPVSAAMRRVCMHMMQVNVRAVGHFSQFCVCVYVCVCVSSLLWMSSLPVLKQRTQSAVPGMLPSLWAAGTLWADAVGSYSSRTHKANLGTWS